MHIRGRCRASRLLSRDEGSATRALKQRPKPAANEYLSRCGAVPISVTERGTIRLRCGLGLK
jgi:hypothetical protein